MEHRVSYYRLVLKEPLRKFLGINLRYKKIYVFKLKQHLYLSTDMIPKTTEYIVLPVKLGRHRWFIDIPNTLLDYEPASYRFVNTPGRVLKLTPNIKK